MVSELNLTGRFCKPVFSVSGLKSQDLYAIVGSQTQAKDFSSMMKPPTVSNLCSTCKNAEILPVRFDDGESF